MDGDHTATTTEKQQALLISSYKKSLSMLCNA